MHLKRIALTAALFVSPLFAIAEKHHDHHHHHEHRQHGAHVHGVAALNLVQEGGEVHIELHGPAANFVGFEHAPASAADHAALDQAVALLKEGDQLFRFNAEAGCRMEHARIDSALLEEEPHGHEDEHAHEKHDDHEHEDEGEVHSDLEAEYHFECTEPGRLNRLAVELFGSFQGLEKLKTQYVVGAGQGGAELTARNPVVRF